MKKLLKYLTLLLAIASAVILSSCSVTAHDNEDKTDAWLTSDTNATGSTLITMPTIFADGCVFQQGKTINVFGYSDKNGSAVRVTLGDDVAEGVVSGGRFSVALPSRGIATDLTLTIELLGYEDAVLTYTDVAVGEVWVVSGQSNADYEVQRMEDYAEYLANADNYPNLRLYTTPNHYTYKPNLDGDGQWMTLNSDALRANKRVSAHMYVTAVGLAAEFGKDVPVAVIHVAKTASNIITWLDYETLRQCDSGSAAAFKAYDEFYDAHGFYPRNTSDSSYYTESRTNKPHAALGTICYNTYLAHLEGYSVKGVVWYQGESNCSTNTGYYTGCFDGLRSVMGRVFGGDGELPMFIVQLSTYGETSHTSAGVFRSEQYSIARDRDNVYLISAVQEGTPMNTNDLKYGLIHSSRKSPLGLRCLNSILSNIYGIGDLATVNAPQPISVSSSAGTLTVTFNSDLYYTYGDRPMGFEIYSNGTWYAAEGRVTGSVLTLYADGATNPTQVRYGFGNYFIEMQDGTRVKVKSYSAVGYQYTDVTLVDGTVVRMYPDDNTRLRLMVEGNITNVSGEPLFVFTLNVGQ